MIRIDSIIADVRRAIEEYGRQFPKAVRNAINDTAFKVMAAERAEIASSFDRPKPFIMKNVRVFKASADRLSATVGATDYFERAGLQTKGTAWERILAPHVYGGSRLQKASERRLRMAGFLPDGWFTVPGQAAKRDSYGNISGPELVAVLSWVGAMGQYAGDNTNKRDRLTNRKNKTEKRGESYFVARIGNRSGLHPGVYKRLKSRQIKPILMFVSSVNYSKRLRWFETGEAVIRREFPPALAHQVARIQNA